MTPREIAQRMKQEWTPTRFCRKAMFRDSMGEILEVMDPHDPSIDSMCFLGALSRVTTYEEEPSVEEFCSFVTQRITEKLGRGSIVAVNDEHPNGYEELINIIDEYLVLTAQHEGLPVEIIEEKELVAV